MPETPIAQATDLKPESLKDLSPTQQLSALTKYASELADKLTAANFEVAEIKQKLNLVQSTLLPAIMGELGLDSIKLKDGPQMDLARVTEVSSPAKKLAAAIAWLRANGHDDIITKKLVVEGDDADRVAEEIQDDCTNFSLTESLHAARLKAWGNEMIEKGEELPTSAFTVNSFDWVKIK